MPQHLMGKGSRNAPQQREMAGKDLLSSLETRCQIAGSDEHRNKRWLNDRETKGLLALNETGFGNGREAGGDRGRNGSSHPVRMPEAIHGSPQKSIDKNKNKNPKESGEDEQQIKHIIRRCPTGVLEQQSDIRSTLSPCGSVGKLISGAIFGLF